MSNFFTMPEKEIILLSAATAILLIENLDADEQNTLGNFLMSVGQNIVLAANQKAIRGQIQENQKNKSKLKDGNDK